MSIQWYPGHMFKAKKQIKEALPEVDLIIEIIDARIPFSSENPDIAKLRHDKPCIKLLNKSDLADPDLTAQWIDAFQQQQGVRALAITAQQPEQVRQITALCHQMIPHRSNRHRPIHSMIMGIPNVGKSTIINILAGRVVAKTGNEPAVTKNQQRIRLADDITLSDTPGILWPKVESEHSGYRLAATGAIKDTAISYDDVAFFTAQYLLTAYPQALRQRYQLEMLPATELELLEQIGRRRGCLRAGGKVDLLKVCTLFMHEYRAGLLGRITLESPAMIAQEMRELVIKQAAEAEQKAAKKAERLAKRKKR